MLNKCIPFRFTHKSHRIASEEHHKIQGSVTFIGNPKHTHRSFVLLFFLSFLSFYFRLSLTRTRLVSNKCDFYTFPHRITLSESNWNNFIDVIRVELAVVCVHCVLCVVIARNTNQICRKPLVCYIHGTKTRWIWISKDFFQVLSSRARVNRVFLFLSYTSFLQFTF